MAILEENQNNVGTHGFPTYIDNTIDVLYVAWDVASYLKSKQKSVVEAFKSPLKARFGETLVSTNIHYNSFVPPEIEAYQKIKKAISTLSYVGGVSLNIGFLAEESHPVEARNSSDGMWVIDPIHNLSSYLKGEDDWSLSIGFAVAGQPTGGVIYYPNKRELLYTGDDGKSYGQDKLGKRIEIQKVCFDQKPKNAGTECLTPVFAKQSKLPAPSTNPDVISNVALQAIVSRVKSQEGHRVNPDMPFYVYPSKPSMTFAEYAATLR